VSDWGVSGLGLSIVKEMTDALDGQIEVDTEKGEGTRVVVQLLAGETV
jgi:signal transduction histidine kinase